jgi:zinc-ribbon domain
MVCPNCGEENPDVAKFCFACGTELQAVSCLYDEIGSLTDVALVQLRAAQKLVAAEQRSEAEVHLRSAMSFYRSRHATRFIREAETLPAATA